MGRRIASAGLVSVALLLLPAIGCSPRESREADAVRSVLAQDDSLGTARNHAPETMPLTQSIRDYVAGLEAIDFSGCPEDFTTAFARHRAAWERSVDFFASFDELRGEMHDLFEQIRQGDADTRTRLESVEEDIWGTWAEVEAAARRAGALPAVE